MQDPVDLHANTISRRNYGVFLSFRGPDCRHTIISHLYNALQQKGVFVFKDSEELETGQKRSELFGAIEGSNIAIVMFSKNYARSKWCLDELGKIMECKEQGKLTVLPIFYHVSPGEVRLHVNDKGEKGCYQKSMEEMETRYDKDSETMKRWRNALWQGGDLIGISLDQGHDEGSAIQEIVEKVLKLLNRVPLEVAKHPVGIGRNLKAIRPLLHIDPHVNDVYMVGLLGQGGVGKTTLAKAICNDIADKFDSWCFLPNVREMTLRVINGLAQMQETLLHELLSDKDLKVRSVDAGKELIKERLRNKRVLVILDDVDASNQLDALAGNSTWFGKGSRIIITTRDEHVLTSIECIVYPVALLDKQEARTLFLLHAFGKKQEEANIDSALIDSMVKYAGELPLALVVLGAFLLDRSQSEWKGKLKELKESPDGTINSVLKVSFDGLEDNHKEIFLDVACFFSGRKINDVKKILDSCGFATSLGITILAERCLVTVVGELIYMHELLCAMGQSIARDDCLKRNEIPSRIWLYEDLLDILSNDWSMQERQALKGIVVESDEINVDGSLIKFNELKGFKKLRVLILLNVDNPYEPVRLPRELRWLEWLSYSAPSIEFDPSSKLVFLDLSYRNIQQINGKGFKELMYVNLSYCSSLIRLPDLSKCFKLEELVLDNCRSLIELDEGIGSLENLVHLNLRNCKNLTVAPSSLRWKRLQRLDFYGCFKLEKLPAIKDENKFLKKLDLSKTAIKELPDSFCNLMALKELFLSNCRELTTIPSSIYKMQALEVLLLSNCLKLSGFPRRVATNVIGCPNLVVLEISNCMLTDLEFLNDLTCFETLKRLNLSFNDFAQVPACISQFNNLKTVFLSDCRELTTIPSSIYKMQALEVLLLKTCLKLSGFPRRAAMNVIGCPNLVALEISDCMLTDLEFLNDLTCFETLKILNLSFNDFTQVPACIIQFNNLEKLSMHSCIHLIQVLELPNFSKLYVTGSRWLKTLPSLHMFICQSPKCFTVDLSNCHSLDRGYLDRSLPLETVRGFVGTADVIVPGEEFPHWVNFQTTECGSRYRVSVSRNTSEDDLLGLALFVTLHFPEGPNNRSLAAFVWVDGLPLAKYPKNLGGGVHSWFVYIARQSRWEGRDIAASLNWRNFTLDFSVAGGMKLQRWGMRLLCKQEQDDHRIRVRKDNDELMKKKKKKSRMTSDSSGSEYESAVECDCVTDYESAQSEW